MSIFGGDLSQYSTDALNRYTGMNPDTQRWNTYAPEAYDPTMANANLVQNDPMTQGAQLSALKQMGNLAQTGLSDVDQAGFQNARNIGGQMAASGTAAALQNAQARGISGSGSELAMREIAGQQGAQAAQQAGLQQAADSARQRALYNQAYLGGLGNYRAQNESVNAQNAGILNQFNMANTNAINQANQYNTGNQNQAQLINTQGQNAANQQNFQNQMGINQGIMGADQMGANATAADQAANASFVNGLMKLGTSAAAG